MIVGARMSRSLALVLVCMLGSLGCSGADSGENGLTGHAERPSATSSTSAQEPVSGNDADVAATSSTRPPLSDPPDPGSPPSHHGFDAEAIEEAVASSVRITGLSCNILREGSGFAVGDGDLIVTNAHVMVGLLEPEVETIDGRKLDAVVVAFDAVSDVAILRVKGAGLAPLPLSDTAPDGSVGAVLAWEDDAEPEPTPFKIDRPVRVITDIVAGDERVERPSWLLAANTESGDSGAALVLRDEQGRTVAVGVAWGASRRGGASYATRASAVRELLESEDLNEPVEVPDCRKPL